MTRSKLPPLEPPDRARVVARRVGDHLGRNLLQSGDEVLEGRIVILQLALGLGHESCQVRLQLVVLLADVPDAVHHKDRIIEYRLRRGSAQ